MIFEKEQVWRRMITQDQYETFYCTAEELEREEFRDWVKSRLWEGVALVEFAKANGELRVMECTLSELYGAKHPERKLTESGTLVPIVERKHNPDVCAVWDIKQSAWRSFRWDRVKRIDLNIS